MLREAYYVIHDLKGCDRDDQMERLKYRTEFFKTNKALENTGLSRAFVEN